MLTHLNNLLIVLRLRRPNQWSPPTPLDWLLTSPLQWLTSLLYHNLLLPLRGRPFHPPRGGRRRIRVVCLSDTHNRTLPPAAVPDGDLLIHCGDLTEEGTVGEIQAQADWLKGFPHRWKVVVGGNHDAWLDPATRAAPGAGPGEDGVGKAEVDWTGLEYLCDRAVELEFEGGRRLNVYGWGALPWCGEGFA